VIQITDRDHRRFTWGDCHILARAIHKRHGFPVASLIHKFPSGYEELDLHCFNLCPGGHPLDIHGCWNRSAFKKEWHVGRSHVVRAVTPEQYREWVMPVQFGHYSYRRARQVAQQLHTLPLCAKARKACKPAEK